MCFDALGVLKLNQDKTKIYYLLSPDLPTSVKNVFSYSCIVYWKSKMGSYAAAMKQKRLQIPHELQWFSLS